MSCCGKREKQGEVKAEQKWDYINLSDFKSSSCWTGFSYGVLYMSLVISVAVYGVDTFTAANLLLFNRWSGQVKPAIPFKISRWIFAGCIILSFVLLIYRWMKAIRAIKSGIVAASYLDPLAVRVQSVRTGANGRGWRRFLVFTALTKHRKGAEYVALFTYFSFEAWLRIVFAEGPRQGINALTLYSVMQANLLPEGQHSASHGHSSIGQFFVNVQILAESNRQQAVILFSMLFTLIIWVFSALSLIVAVLFYLFFLLHHVPSADGSLSNYCRRKVDSRLHKIVGAKVNKALARENQALTKQDTMDGVLGERPHIKRQPTVPVLDIPQDDKLQEMPLLQRQGTQATLPPYTSNPPSRNASNSSATLQEPTLPDLLPDRPTIPERSVTQNSNRSDASYTSNAPLIGAASDMGYGQPGVNFSRPPLSRMDSEQSHYSTRPPVGRSATQSSQGTQQSYNTTYGRGPPPPQGDPCAPPRGPPTRQNTSQSDYAPSTRSTPSPFPAQNRKPTPQILPLDAIGKRTPTPANRYPPPPMPVQEFEMRPQPANRPPQNNTNTNNYVAFNPSLHAPTSTTSPPPSRNFTQPPPRPTQPDYFGQTSTPQRSGTAPLPQTSPYDDTIYDEYRNRRSPDRAPRSGTAPPQAWNRPGPAQYAQQQRAPPVRAGTADPWHGPARRQEGPARAGSANPYAQRSGNGPAPGAGAGTDRGPGSYRF